MCRKSGVKVRVRRSFGRDFLVNEKERVMLPEGTQGIVDPYIVNIGNRWSDHYQSNVETNGSSVFEELGVT